MNLDPPVLYVDSRYKPSVALQRFIGENQRLEFTYSTDSDGRRMTLPNVEADRQILIVGDSVAFGVGVSDDATLASFLQRRLKRTFRVVNAGVGSYSAREAIQTATSLSDKGRYELLIHLTSHNDFMEGDTDFADNATAILEELASLGDRFPLGIVLMVMPYMEFSLNDLLLDYGWTGETADQSESLFEKLPVIATRLGIEYIDLLRMMEDYSKEAGTIFGHFAFYVDHCHMSPLANRLGAEELDSLITPPPG